MKQVLLPSKIKQEWCWSNILKYRTLSSGQLHLRQIWRRSASYWWDLLLWQTHKVCKVNLCCLANCFSETVFGVLFVAVQQMALRKIDFSQITSLSPPGKPQQMYIWLDLKHPLSAWHAPVSQVADNFQLVFHNGNRDVSLLRRWWLTGWCGGPEEGNFICGNTYQCTHYT